jgi:hypothetical protein
MCVCMCIHFLFFVLLLLLLFEASNSQPYFSLLCAGITGGATIAVTPLLLGLGGNTWRKEHVVEQSY